MHEMLGVEAKIDRAVEQLQTLHREVLALRNDPHAWAINQASNADRTEHVIRVNPRWDPRRPGRWGAIVGEIVHDLRSALDHIAWELVLANGETPDDFTSFPIYKTEPEQGFVAATTWDKRPAKERHGPLVGVNTSALTQIEGCQPYHGGNNALLGVLNELWNIDKHRHLLPMLVVSAMPQIETTNAKLIEQRIERDRQGAQFVRVIVEPIGPDNAQVHVKPDLPIDIALSVGGGAVAVIDTLRHLTTHVLTSVYHPLGQRVPDNINEIISQAQRDSSTET